jgi:hypothetical protein
MILNWVVNFKALLNSKWGFSFQFKTSFLFIIFQITDGIYNNFTHISTLNTAPHQPQ